LTVSNSGTVLAYDLTLGDVSGPAITGNSLVVAGGNVNVTNRLQMGYYSVLRLDSGLITAGNLASYGGVPATFNFNGGTLQTHGTFWSVNPFVVGNGSGAPLFELLSGNHYFDAGLIISSNATLTGIGTIIGNVSVLSGATIAPGSSIGQLSISKGLTLNDGSTTAMELNAGAGTCDTIVGMTNVTYGGVLELTNLAGALTNGSWFRLFSASSYSGAFRALAPASPGTGLKWNTNELNVDGVLRVVAIQSPLPSIAGLQLLGSTLRIQASGGIPYDPCYLLSTTNLAASAGWEALATNHFDAFGNAVFGLPVSVDEPSRFFQVRVE
jgi:hypothetical protein